MKSRLGLASRGPLWRGLWLLFAQAVTIMLALLFVLALFGGLERRGDDSSWLRGLYPSDLTFSRSLERILPSVVHIKALEEGADPTDPAADFSIGSGVIVSAGGHILTNHHVIDSGGEVTVITSSGESLVAELVGSDPATDIAVLKVSPTTTLTAASFHDLRNPVQVGDLVMAVGSPYGLQSTASLGIVSAIGRSSLGLSRYEHYIQTDAAINHGSSGGALADANGDLVGISTALFARRSTDGYAQGIGFAIPAELARTAYEQIIANGHFKRGWIGLLLSPPDPLDASATLDALVVDAVEPNSPGARAGILVGDLIISLDGRKPSQISSLEEATGKLLQPGAEIEVVWRRDDRRFSEILQVEQR